MKHSDCTISIVTHSNLEGCKRTLSAVLESREGARLVLTSNGNPEVEEHFKKLASQRDRITVSINDTNHGFIHPNNVAFEICDTPLFVLLNDDAIPPHNWLDALKAAIEPGDIAVAGPGMRWLDRNFIGHPCSVVTPEPDFVEGSCMMVKADIIRQNQESLFWNALKLAYAEDADLCLRLRQRGYKIAHANFPLQHKSGTTTRTVPELHDTMKNNFVLCARRWGRYLETRQFK